MYSSILLSLACLAVGINADSKERKAIHTPGNASTPLTSRSLVARQLVCPDGTGECDAGQCCGLDEGCCGSYNCAPTGFLCCGDQGEVYPTDGSECCS